MTQPDILLVDDEPDILELGLTVLRGAGYQVMSAISGDIALIYIQQGVRCRVLITDVILPGVLDGIALAHEARALDVNLQVIYSTGFAGPAQVRALGAPYGKLLMKPWRPQELLDAVAPLLDHTAAA